MPHSFYQKVVKEELGLDLGAPNTYGSGIIFTPHSQDLVKYMHELFASQASLYGFEVIGWRTLKTGEGKQLTSNIDLLSTEIAVFSTESCRQQHTW